MPSDYVPDRLYQRLFTPWTLPESEWPLCREDWARVDAVTALPWHGRVLDVGSGDGTLGAMVCSRNPRVTRVVGVEPDDAQRAKAQDKWWLMGREDEPWPTRYRASIDSALCVDREPRDPVVPFDCALCCEVLEHITPADGLALLKRIHAALVPGGMLCVTVPVPGGSRAEYAGHINVMSADDLLLMLIDAGFKPIRESDVPMTGGTIWLRVVAHAV